MRSIIFFLGFFSFSIAFALPEGFVYLQDVEPSILQDMRYATHHNFIGKPITGYESSLCILTKQAASALAEVQHEVQSLGYTLKVYDCYRPQRAVDEFIAWSKQSDQQSMKKEFYPNVNKADFFKLGYVAEKSGHTRGSTVDLTLVPLHYHPSATYHPGQRLIACFSPNRFHDNSIEMGTGFDCMDERLHSLNQTINPTAYQNRMILRTMMMKHGFNPLAEEWWHFTLKDEPYPTTYFDFVVN